MANPQAGKQQIPKLDTPVVNPGGTLSIPWQKFLTSLWQRSGGGLAATPATVYLQLTANGILQAFRSIPGAFIGDIPLSGGGGAQPVVQVLGASPFVFTALQSGVLVINQGQVDISRDGGSTYYNLGVLGGSPHILSGDKVKVTWFSTVAPSVVFFGDNAL